MNKINFKYNNFNTMFLEVKKNYPLDWLLPLEMYELVYKSSLKIEKETYNYLLQLKENEQYTQLISNGIELILIKN